MSIRVVLADDQALMRSGLRLLLEAQPDIRVVGEANDGLEATHLVRELRPDVVLMDIQMPRLDGIEATRRIRASESGPAVVVLTTFEEDSTYSKRCARGQVASF